MNDFTQWRARLAKMMKGKAFMLPNSDRLFSLWQLGRTPEEVARDCKEFYAQHQRTKTSCD